MSISVKDTTGALAATPLLISTRRSPQDRLFRGVSRTAGLTTLVILVLIGLFLALQSRLAFQTMGWAFFTNTGWVTTGPHPQFGVLSALTGTLIISGIAMFVAVPVALACALFINEFAPRQVLGFFPLKNFLTAMVDLMAAVPSIIFGMWGFFVLQPSMKGLSRWLSDYLGFIPFFKTTDTPIYTSSFLIAGTLVGIMVMPIVTSLSREVFSLTPVAEREGAMSLGASRARVIRDVVFPFSKGGMVGAIMLGLGRALGEAIAVAIIISLTFQPSIHVTQAGGNSIAALIAFRFGSGGPIGLSGLLAAGLVLFVITLAINLVAARIVNRSKMGA
jgi:phosphate transport system permease protein